MSITQKEIGDRLGLSRQTVGFALSDESWAQNQLRPETRDLVLKTARKLGYVPHFGARRMALTRSTSRGANFDQVGLISLIGADEYVDVACHAMMGGAEHELSKLHASLTFVRVNAPEDWSKVERLTRAGGVDGWLLYGAVDDGVVNRLEAGQLPYVILGDHRCTKPVASAQIDYVGVGRLAVQHLASLGHRRIACLQTNQKLGYRRRMLEGFRAAIQELGLDDEERLILTPPDPYKDHWFKARIESCRDAGLMPTAMFIPHSDVGAVWDVLKELHLDVPKDISVLPCEHVTFAATHQNFTRIEVSVAEVGRQGALLLHKLASQARVESKEVWIHPILIQGWSVCPPGQLEPKPNKETKGEST